MSELQRVVENLAISDSLNVVLNCRAINSAHRLSRDYRASGEWFMAPKDRVMAAIKQAYESAKGPK